MPGIYSRQDRQDRQEKKSCERHDSSWRAWRSWRENLFSGPEARQDARNLLISLRQREIERRARADLRVCPHLAAVPLNDLPHDCETDAAAFELVCAVQALE